MSHPAYPIDSDYQTFVTDSGQILPSGYTFTGVGAMVSAMFEQEMGYIPFLQDASATARTYDPPGIQPPSKAWGGWFGGGRVLQLYAAIQDATAISSVTVNGAAQVLNTDYVLKPQNAPSTKRPYNRINFLCPQWGTANSVIIMAKWGVQSNLSEDVWQGLLRLGAAVAASDILEGIRTGEISVKQGDETFAFNPNLIAEMGASWKRESDRMLMPYKLTNVGIT